MLPMQSFLYITKALADEARVRALVSLADGELCVCQIIEMLGLAPSTVSKHMSILHQAGLVKQRKEGRWHYYQLPGRDAPAEVRQVIRWALRSLEQEKVIVQDAKAMCCVRKKNREEVAACYSAK